MKNEGSIVLKNRYSLLSLVLLVNLVGCSIPPTKLSQFPFRAASVLPLITHNNELCVILSREAFGSARGTYDDFGGSRDKGEEHPVVTAAREFYEEAILQKTIGLNVKEVQNYIDIIKTDNTLYVVAYSQKHTKNVTYVTDFNQYKDEFLNNFYPARRDVADFHLREKDRIAIVRYEDLEIAAAKTENTKNAKIQALVLDPKTQEWYHSHIKLRPFFVQKLRPFLLNQTYEQGLDEKIRFYNE
jgi:8-oxo-dGTP pyrophosphatase MutT (NUDIX family)